MFVTAAVPQALSTPGWQIEKKYSTKVLVGNWVEESRKVRKDSPWGNSSGRSEVCFSQMGGSLQLSLNIMVFMLYTGKMHSHSN